ncbi:MAG TPA: hypothetical protein VFO34_07885 [Candidatus Acidoferrales bacterium]|nr:hypothetical protein [Candidatus Acidoferrales bacterium]
MTHQRTLTAARILSHLLIAIGVVLSETALPSAAQPQQSSAGQPPATAPADDPSGILANALSAACRHDVNAFSGFLTAGSATAYRALDSTQQIAFLRRIVQLQDNGVPLLSAGLDGHPVFRCETSGFTAEFRFGSPRMDENIVFVPVHVMDRSVDFGLVRTSAGWKLLSLGVIVLDVNQLASMWQREDLQAREDTAISAVRSIAAAIDAYHRAFERLPESLKELGPAPTEGISPEAAGLLTAELAAGRIEGYNIRYRIVPVVEGHPTEFELAATPTDYPKSAIRSFFIDSSGVLRAADKRGAPATLADPPLDSTQP